jgi:Protein of unknown function (DUF998)
MSIAHRPGRRLPIAAAWPVPSSQAGHPWAIISAGLAPILLTGAYLMTGILQPSSYSPVRTTISAMAGQAGTDRWVMTGGIFLVGCCYLVTAAGLTGDWQQAPRLLITSSAAASVSFATAYAWTCESVPRSRRIDSRMTNVVLAV